MRSLSSPVFFFLLSLLFLVAKSSDARKDPAAAADYWKSMMKGEPMPTAIEEILVRDHGAEYSVSKQNGEKKKRWDPSKINMAHFKRDFDATPNAIIYHSHNHMGHDQTHGKSLVYGRGGVVEGSE